MKKGFWKMLATGIAAAVVGGCVEHDEGADASRKIGFDVAAAESRAIIEEAGDMETFDVWGWYTSTGGASIDVFGTPNASGEYTGVKVENTGGAWRYEGERYWVADVSYNFYAAHPAGLSGATCTNEGRLAVKEFDASDMGEKAVDLMTASVTNRIYRAGGNNQVGFTFHHELARVQVVVNAGQGVKVEVSGAKVYGVSTRGDFARELGTPTATGAWSSLETAVTEENTPYSFSGNTELNGDGATNQATVLDLAVIPQEITDARLVLTYQREGDTERTTEPLRLDQNSTTWSAGSAYRYTLNVEVDAITFSGFTVDEWGYSYSGGDINIGGTTNNGN